MRVFTLASTLIEMGHELHFVHVEKEHGDRKAMTAFWQERYHPLRYLKPPRPLIVKLAFKIGSIFNTHLKYTYLIDEWYDPSITQKILQLHQFFKFDVVIVEYVFMSKLLEAFDKKILKLIDTHDVFTNRHFTYLKNNHRPNWFSTTAGQEKKGLRRADRIIAIQDHEKKFFEKLTSQQVITVGHFPIQYKIAPAPGKNQILFIGSANPINIQAANYFIDEVFPKVREKIADSKFLIAGHVCDFIINASESVIKLGVVDRLEQVYEKADVVVNPVKYGTGLKIKTIEALGFAKPMVTTRAGAKGIEKGASRAFKVADTPDTFASAIIEILTLPDIYNNIVKNAILYNEIENRKYLNALSKVLH